jgi:hypothetical protein
MASRSTRSTTARPNEYYTCKWGKVLIFNGENYPQFSLSCRGTLIAAQAWSIVAGQEREPRGDGEADYNKRRNLGISIIFGSVHPDYLHLLEPFLNTSDPQGMWDKLKTADRGRDAMFIANIRSQFARELFDPTTQTIREFKRILDSYRNQIASTPAPNPISDEEAKQKLLQALPRGIGGEGWQTAKMWCIKEKLSYEQCVTSLESFEGPPALPEGSVNRYRANTSVADTAIATHRNRSHTKDNRPDSRPPKRPYNTRSQSTNKRPRRDPSPSPSESSSSVASDSSIPSIDPHSGRCYYCGRKGHIQTDCDEYNKGRHRSHRKYGGKGVKKTKKESRTNHSSHIAQADRRPSPPF